MALSLPGLVSLLVEPPLGVLSDRGWRRRIVAGGGLAFTAGLALLAASPTFVVLLLALGILYPASGAFVSISQAALVDLDPGRGGHNLAVWTVAGSVGAAVGPLFVAAGLPWRGVFAGYAAVAALLTLAVSRQDLGGAGSGSDPAADGLRAALRLPGVIRWLVLLELESLGTDVLFGFLALDLVDTVHASAQVAALCVAVCTGAGLVGNVALVRALRFVDPLRLLRASAAVAAPCLIGFQLAPGVPAKLLFAGALGLASSCWYPISQARLYAALPGTSGMATAVATCASAVGIGLPLLLGAVAGAVGLGDGLWLCVAAPLALLLGVPRG